jgi:NADH-quinone oxidoreductase subunit E
VSSSTIEQVVTQVISKYSGKPGALLGILEELQNNNKSKYLPPETMELVAQKLHIPLANIYSVVTFYAFFNLQPQGEHTIVICRGTACHTRGSRELLETLKLLFTFEDTEAADSGKVFMTTKDKKFTIKTIACFGQCALAPVIEIDGVVYGNMTVAKMKELISQTEAKTVRPKPSKKRSK